MAARSAAFAGQIRISPIAATISTAEFARAKGKSLFGAATFNSMGRPLVNGFCSISTDQERISPARTQIYRLRI